jgi:hypothetical protein
VQKELSAEDELPGTDPDKIIFSTLLLRFFLCGFFRLNAERGTYSFSAGTLTVYF